MKYSPLHSTPLYSTLLYTTFLSPVYDTVVVQVAQSPQNLSGVVAHSADFKRSEMLQQMRHRAAYRSIRTYGQTYIRRKR